MLIFESSFPEDFRTNEIKKILDYVTTGKFCQIVCIPGGGKATILRLLAHNRNLLKFHLKEREKNLRFVYLNLHDLANFEEKEVLKFLLVTLTHKTPDTDDAHLLSGQLHEFVNSLSHEGHTLVFLFDHFDEFQNLLPHSFFHLLKDLSTSAKYKFAAIFGTRRNLEELVDPETLKEFYDFFIGNAVYISLKDTNALEFLFKQIEDVFGKKLETKKKEKIVQLTGGHTKLTKVVTELAIRDESLKLEELSSNSLAEAALFEIWHFLTAEEQQSLREILEGKATNQDQSFKNLENFGLLKEGEMTIPLLTQFIDNLPKETPKITFDQNTNDIKKGQDIISDLLSPQEYRLLRFFTENEGKVLTRDEIIAVVWPDTKVQEGISDEAIDQMVFRLRKKIEEEPNSPEHVVTVKGQGWRFRG